MLKLCFEILWTLFLIYTLHSSLTMEKGIAKRVVLILITTVIQIIACFFQQNLLGDTVAAGIIVLYDLFYCETSIRIHYRQLIFMVSFWIFTVLISQYLSVRWLPLLTQCYLFLQFIYLGRERGYLTKRMTILSVPIYGVLIFVHIFINLDCIMILTGFRDLNTASVEILNSAVLLFGIFMFFFLEKTIHSYMNTFEIQTTSFQQEVLLQQYDEIQAIYLNMRGWRHDYHNHMQVLKANLALKQYEEANTYLNRLEQELAKVDTYVKTGNLMLDAILNSKLSIAESVKIKIRCDVNVPDESNEQLSILR